MKTADPIVCIAAALSAVGALSASALEDDGAVRCAEGEILSTGPVDEAVFSRAASRNVRARWCERYDELGDAERVGAYQEHYPDGRLRVEAAYVAGRLDGAVTAYHESGEIFLRGTLRNGTWHGPLLLHHENGTTWWAGTLRGGRLHGRVAIYHRDGGLAGESHFQAGREDGASRSFYPRAQGGGVRSEVHVEADQLVGVHRVFDPAGNVRLRADRDPAPSDWSMPSAATAPASPTPNPTPEPGVEGAARAGTRPND